MIFVQSINESIITITDGTKRAKATNILRVQVVESTRRLIIKSAKIPDKLIETKQAIYGIDDNKPF